MYTKNDLNVILKARDNFKVDSKIWNDLDNLKSEILSQIKPSTKEKIIYYRQSDLNNINEGFFKTSEPPSIKTFIGKRSKLEYDGALFRHPIPYIILKYRNKYFFILREKGSGEIRLEGKKGMVGGHVGSEGIIEGMYRELGEEVAVDKSMIRSLTLKGLIKSNNGVDADHLGCLYEIELNTDKIKAEENGVLSGLWIDKKDLYKHYTSFESWSKIAYDNVLKFE